MGEIHDLIKSLNIGNEAIALRRRLHMYPELSEHEYDTMALICEKLEQLDIPFKKNVAGTGVTGLIKGAFDGPCAGIRADMDALPIDEKNSHLPYCSKIPGIMHACGHDAHTAILLGAAAVLSRMRDSLAGSVKLIFQPAEETVGGAERMIAQGCLKDPYVDYMFGLHVDTGLPAGQIGIKYGQMYAASDMLTLKVYGTSCHGAHPEKGVDAILIAAQIINAVQTVVSRNISPTDPAVCTLGTIRGGNVRNQIADYVELTGIIRTLDADTRLYARRRVKMICEQTALMQGGRAELIVEPSYSPLINDDGMADLVRNTAAKAIGEENVVLEKTPSLGVEDFAYFAAARPSCFFHLGCAGKDPESRLAHSCYFDIDESCIPLGIELHVENVLSLLNLRRRP